MKRFLVLTLTLGAAAVLLLVLPLGAGATSDKRFVLSWRGAFTGGTEGAGTFVVGGGISDSGTFTAAYTVTPATGCSSLISGDETYTAADGSFTFHTTGTSFTPLCDGHAIFDGQFTITGGTGAFAGLSGKGTVTSLANFNDGTFTGVHDGTAHLTH
jgi:hypothetical protein